MSTWGDVLVVGAGWWGRSSAGSVTDQLLLVEKEVDVSFGTSRQTVESFIPAFSQTGTLNTTASGAASCSGTSGRVGVLI